MITFSIQEAALSTPTFDDICFLYTDDKGETWKYVNGTSFTTPTTFNQTRIILAENMTRYAWSPIIDTANDDRLCMGYCQNDIPYMLYYNTTVGNVGTWENGTIKYENGTTLGRTDFNGFIDNYYNRISFWAAPTESNSTRYLKKLVQIPNELYKFRVVWTDPTYSFTHIKQTLRFGIIQNAPQAYEAVIGEQYWDALGNLTEKTNQLPMQNGTYYGFKYIAQQTCNLTSVRFFGNFTLDSKYYDAAIYNSTFDLLGYATSDKMAVDTDIHWSWAVSFSHTNGIPVITQGESYWIVIKTYDYNDTANLYYDESDTLYENMSLIKVDVGDDWLETLTDFTYYNRTARITAYPAWLIVRGLGVDEYATTFSDIGSNATEIATPCKFYAYVLDGSGLSNATLYWNVTGVMISNGTISLSGTESWANFSRTLPDSHMVVMWLINAKDTYGNGDNCTTQYLTITEEKDFFGILAMQFSLLTQKLLEFNRFGIFNPTFTVNTQKTVAFSLSSLINPIFSVTSLFSSGVILELFGAIAQAISLAFQRAVSFDRHSVITSIVNVQFQKAVAFNLHSTINPTFTVTGIADFISGQILNLFGVIQQVFTSDFQKTFSFSRYSAINPVFSIDGIFSSGAFLNLFGSIIQQFTVAIQKALTFTHYSTLNPISGIDSIAQFTQPGILNFYGIINQVLNIVGWTDLTPTIAYATKGFVLAALFLIVLVLVPVIFIVWRRK